MKKTKYSFILILGWLFLYGCQNASETQTETGMKTPSASETQNEIKSQETTRSKDEHMFHEKVTTDIIQTTSNEALVPTVYDTLLTKSFTNKWVPSALTKGQEIFLTIWDLQSDIYNRGLYQYYLNRGGESWTKVYENLITIGATKHAEIIKQANEKYNSNKDTIKKNDGANSQPQNNIFNDLDQKFIHETEENLNALLGQYIKDHSSDFTQ